jgi:hypothetical protein
MLTLEVVAQPAIDPAASHVLDVELLAAAAGQPQRAGLRVYACNGDVLSLGRYHIAPAGDPDRAVIVHRRLGGGRVLPLGQGFVVLALTLPQRSALVSADAVALRPEQVLNRCVRALLGGLRRLGVDAFYPGRDRITVDRRMLGCVALECDASGAALFEAVLAVDGDWLSLPQLVAAADPAGVIAAELPNADQVTTLAAHGATPPAAELAHCVAASYAKQFGLALAAGTDPPVPPNAGPRAAAWVASRRLRSELNRHAVSWGQLGVLEVYLAAPENTIADLLLSGDFIADSPSIARLEHRLRGCPLERAALEAIVASVYSDPHSFLLGLGPPQAIVDTILSAA